VCQSLLGAIMSILSYIKFKSIYFSLILTGLIFFQFVFQPNTVTGQSEPPAKEVNSELAHYNDLIEQLKKVDYATQCARNAVKAFADSAFLPELLFQLSEWEIQREKLNFELAIYKYDHQIELFENGKIKQEPVEPKLNFQKSLELNRQIVEDYPDVPFINKVLYRTGICLYDTGNKDSSKVIFQKLVTEHPDTTYLADALFRLGECYFDDGEYEKAIQAYKQIIEDWRSAFFAMALYKIAWCHYRLNHFSKAISTFYYLLSDIKLIEDVNSELFGKSQVQLKNEIMEYITISFSDFGGASSLYDFSERMGGSSYTPYLLHKLGNVYLKRDFYEDALDALNLLIQKFPYYEKLPEIVMIYFQCLEEMGDMDKAFLLHDLLIKCCGPRSKWAQLHKSEQDIKLYEKILSELDYKIATPLINTADSLFATKNYEEGIEKYSKFLRIFAKDERAGHASYCLAECYYNFYDYENAANAYKKVVENYPGNELREDAAYNYVVCYDNLLKNSNIPLDDNSVSIKKNKDLKNFIVACHNYLKWFPKSNKEPEIKLKLAEIFYRKKLYAAGEKYARSALVSIMKHKRGVQHKTNALNLLVQLSFNQEKYNNTELLSTLLLQENPDSTELVERTKKLLASTSFKIGEKLKSKGRNELAAMKFEQAALKSSDPHIAEASLFEAAIQYEEAKQFNRAAFKFEDFYKKHPQSEHSKEAIYRAALLRDKLEQYQLSSRDYMILHDVTPNIAEASTALYNAGLAYEKAKDWFSMAETFNKYITKYQNDSENILEAIFKVAYAYEQRNMIHQANMEYQRLLNKFNQLKAAGEFADDYFAAQASFRLAEVKHNHFKTIKLNPPFQINLKKKQASFNELMKSYVDVTKYNIADWTTAAFYQLGLSYEEFCQDILDSPAPPNLKEDDLKAYWESINQRLVVPLQHEALKYYQTNEKLAAENNLKNEWIEKTKARILFLSKKLTAESNLISENDQVKQTSSIMSTKTAETKKKL